MQCNTFHTTLMCNAQAPPSLTDPEAISGVGRDKEITSFQNNIKNISF